MNNWPLSARTISSYGYGIAKLGRRQKHAKKFRNETIVYCKWLEQDDDILFAVNADNDDLDIYKLDIKTGRYLSNRFKTRAFAFDVSQTGRYLYSVHKNEETEDYELWETDIAHTENRKLILSASDEIMFPSVNRSRSRLLYETGFDEKTELYVFDMVNETTQSLFHGGDRVFWWPTWLDDDQFLYYPSNKDEDFFGSLCAYSFADSATREIASDIARIPITKESKNEIPFLDPFAGSIAFGGQMKRGILNAKVSMPDSTSGKNSTKWTPSSALWSIPALR